MRSGNWMSECGETPFLLAARGNRSVFVRVWGTELAGAEAEAGAACGTANRVLVYEAQSRRLLRAVCPGAAGAVHVLSAEWWGRGARPAALLLQFVASEPGSARFSWMEVHLLHSHLSLPTYSKYILNSYRHLS